MSEDKTAGVQQLIDRLSDEGVAEGQRKAEQIVSDAQRKSDDMLDSARQEASEILKQAREEAATYQVAGEEALQLAVRDAVRDFSAKIHDGLRNRLQELVQHKLGEPKLLKRMILEITRRATDGLDSEPVELLIPPLAITEEEARNRIEAGDVDALTDFVQGLIGEEVRELFTVGLGSSGQNGLVVRVVDQNVEIDLTEESITDLLALHVLPRFRAIMRKR